MSFTGRAQAATKFVVGGGLVILAGWLLVAYTDWTVNHLEAAGRGIASAAAAVGHFFAGLARAIAT